MFARLRPWYGIALLIPSLTGCQPSSDDSDSYTVVHTDYHPPESDLSRLLPSDSPDSRTPEFDPDLVDRRPLQGYQVNSSAAVIKLDVPMLLPDRDAALMTLYPSYQAALASAKSQNLGSSPVLASVNLIDGQAKQFDDGLYATLDLAYFQGRMEALESHVELVQRIDGKLDPKSPASTFLSAALSLAGHPGTTTGKPELDRWLKVFEASEAQSKPIGFYTWNDDLRRCFRFLRFLQQPFDTKDLAIPGAIASVLKDDDSLREDYRRAITFYARLTNPLVGRSILDLMEPANQDRRDSPVTFFPPSTSRETELFTRLFPLGLPTDADLMRAFITHIRSGEVSLQPRPDSGWYDYQAYALETLLLPEKGRESEKLVFTSSYKKRMMEAFQALMTKRRETHARQLPPGPTAEAPPPMSELVLRPRLRVEPSLTYYLRTARAYAYLNEFLEEAVGKEALQTLHGLSKKGPREKNLSDELKDMRDLFYGFYLLGCEDIGLKPELEPEEAVDRDRCESLASNWLDSIETNPDLSADTRVAVPVFVDNQQRQVTRLWVTLGVRLARLEATYVRPPSVKPVEGEGPWKPLDYDQMEPLNVLIPVDEFAEIELKGNRVLNREELRGLCDRYKTKDAILKALQGL